MKGRFVNQKLGKRASRKVGLLKAWLAADRARVRVKGKDLRIPKKGHSRQPSNP